MKALIYARQSSGKDDVSESVEAQIVNCKKLAARENLEIIGIFKDLNTSGETYPAGAESIALVDTAYQDWVIAQSTKKTFRIGLGEAIALFPSADILLVNELTRLYRPINGSFLEGHINQLLKTNHVQVLQVQGGSIDLTQFDQQLITMIKNQILYEDLQKKRANSMIAFKNKRDSGKLCTGCRCYGIRYLGNDKLEVIPECAEVIRFIFNSICAHRSYRAIIRDCNERWGKKQKIFFYESNIYHIARQPLYAGYQYNTERELIKNVQITGQEIITFDQWKQVHDIVTSKRKTYRTQEKKRSLPLSGRLFCGSCGGRLVVFLDHGNVYYTCNKRTLSKDYKKCGESRIRFSPTQRRSTYALYEAVYPLLSIALVAKLDKISGILAVKDEIAAYEKKLAKMQEEINETYELITAGLASMDDMKAVLLKQKSRKDLLTGKIAEAKASCMNKGILEDFQSSEFFGLLEQIRTRTLNSEKYAELIGIADLTATIYRERMDIHCVYGTFSLPRLMVKGVHGLPLWNMKTIHPNGDSFDQNSSIVITYKTGSRKHLADWKNICIRTV